MASLLERAQNLLDDHQGRQAAADLANVKTQTLKQTRDELLGKVLEVQQSYRDDLAAASGHEARRAVNAQYAARLEGINDAFTVLRQSEPGITTKLNVDEFRRDAERHVEQRALLQSYEHARSQLLDRAPMFSTGKFGSVFGDDPTQTTGIPRFGERASHLEVTQNSEGNYEVTRRTAFYVRDAATGQINPLKEFETGWNAPKVEHTTPDRDEAITYAKNYRAEYQSAARDHHQAGVEHQQREDYYAIHGKYPREEQVRIDRQALAQGQSPNRGIARDINGEGFSF